MIKNQKDTAIKKPKFVLTNEAKFYLATKDMTDENDDGLFFIASLFLPAKKTNVVVMDPRTEIATFDDAESANIYCQTISKMAQINAQTAVFNAHQDVIDKFYGREK